MDPTGVSAAAYAITNQMYSLGLVVMLAIQATGATLVPAALAAHKQKAARGSASPESAAAADRPAAAAAGVALGVARARAVSDRLIGWSTLIAAGMALLQIATLPVVSPLFSTLPAVRAAVVAPAKMAALVQLSNGPLFACEGILMGVGGFGFLAGITCAGVAAMVIGLGEDRKGGERGGASR
jgi:Na+-driven multidrug efflux pump